MGYYQNEEQKWRLITLNSLPPFGELAQSVERAAVNRQVVGSSPSFPAILWISYNGSTPAFQADSEGSIPFIHSTFGRVV